MVRGAISLALAWVGLFAATICNDSVASRVWSALLQSLRQSMARGGRTFVLPNCCDGPAQIISPATNAAVYWMVTGGLLTVGALFVAIAVYAAVCLFRARRTKNT